MITEIIKTTKVSQQKVFLSKDVLQRFDLKEDDKVMWCTNKEGELILMKTETTDFF
ncbi:MAG: hypothetical protein ACFFG0_53375 [Candidatus Thorarchaeota archaeon]